MGSLFEMQTHYASSCTLALLCSSFCKMTRERGTFLLVAYAEWYCRCLAFSMILLWPLVSLSATKEKTMLSHRIVLKVKFSYVFNPCMKPIELALLKKHHWVSSHVYVCLTGKINRLEELWCLEKGMDFWVTDLAFILTLLTYVSVTWSKSLALWT